MYIDIKDNFIPLYKANPPFMKYQGGYGFMGVILQDIESGKIQCHECGKLYKNLVIHFVHMHPKVSAASYRKKVGLNKFVPLQCESTSQKQRNYFLELPKKKQIERMKLLTDAAKKVNKSVRKIKGSIQYQNMFSTCELQAKDRFWKEYTKLGHIPTTDEMTGGLKSIIYTRFGSYEKALLKWGISEADVKDHMKLKQSRAFEARKNAHFYRKYDKETVINQLKKSLNSEGRLPSWTELRRSLVPTRTVIENLFGTKIKSEIEHLLKVESMVN